MNCGGSYDGWLLGKQSQLQIIQSNRKMQEEGKCQLYQKYRIESEIGRGASGTCYRVQHTTSKEIFAMKKIHISSIKKHNTRQACSQVTILSKISHPHIIKLFQSFNDQNYVYIIMQYAPKGDLHNILKRRRIKKDIYSEGEIWEMARQLLAALQYLHSHKIIHRDVKTLNIFVDYSGKLYLGDLGVSKILKNDGGLYSRVGTPLYLAPEIIKYEKYDYKADIWGLGCVCYQLATMSHPFEGKNIISLGQNIVNSQPKVIENYSLDLNSLILEMLEKNPAKRLGAGQILKKFYKDNKPLCSSSISPTPGPSQKSINSNQASSQKAIEPKKQKAIEPKSNNFFDKNDGKERINYDKNPHFLKSNQIRRKVLNNFLEEKLMFHENDLIREDNTNKNMIFKQQKKDTKQKQKQVQKDSQKFRQSNQKSLQDTVVFSRNIKPKQQSKKYVESTHKTYISINSSENKPKNNNNNQSYNHYIKEHPILSQKQTQEQPQAKSIQLQHCARIGQSKNQNYLTSLSSEKKIPSANTQNMLSSKSSKRGFFAPSQSSIDRRQENSKTEVSYADFNRLSSQNHLGSPPTRVARIRPKSGIMTKQRHESTMKNIKKSLRKFQLEESNRVIQTKVLKTPQMIIL